MHRDTFHANPELELPLDEIVPEYRSTNVVVRNLFLGRLAAATGLKPWGGGRLLDVGCGSGRLLARLAGTVPAARLHGVDPNVHLGRLRVAEGCTLQRADVRRLPYADRAFETVYCLDVLEHIDDLRPVLAELDRVLADDGDLVVSIPLESAFYKLCRLVLKGTVSMDQGPAAGTHYWDGRALREELAADFDLVATRSLPVVGPLALFEIVRLRKRRRRPRPAAMVSIVIPVYNERATVDHLLERVLAAPTLGLAREVIVVDDGSTDGTSERLAAHARPPVRLLRHARNRGKGAALRTAFAEARGDLVIVQDADLEYEPGDYPRLLAPLLEGRAEVVYGSRFRGRDRRRHSSLSFFLGGQVVTWAANLLFGLRLTDEPTGYKACWATVPASLGLECEGFEFCAEFTAKVARRGLAILEVPIAYRPRTRDEGKKIGWRDGLAAIRTLARLRRWTPAQGST